MTLDKEKILQRFISYVKIWTTSDSIEADNGIQPSTDRQFDLARILEGQLKALGLKEVHLTDHCYVYGQLPPSQGLENLPSICLLAHMDTVEEVSGKDVNPQIHENYDGSKIILKEGVILDPVTDRDLYAAGENHETVVTTDGTTLLGADDKAGITAIMAMVEYFAAKPQVPHRKIEVMFSPDEETGHGMDNVPLDLISSKCAYTVDGGHIGELESQCFNAWKSLVTFTGKSKHTGSARPDMVNAIMMASSFLQNLPRGQAPETTDGIQGFYAPMDIQGSIESARVTLFLRDFTEEGMESRKKLVDQLAQTTAMVYGGQAEVKHTFQYANMKEGLDKAPEVVENLIQAYKKAGIEPKFIPIRGGTDGSRLTEMGIPTPNIFTGGHNYHARTEWLSLEQMVKAAEILVHLAGDTEKK